MENDKKQPALEIWFRLAKAYNQYKKFQKNEINDESLTMHEFEVLEILSKTGPIPQIKISQKMMVTKTSITCFIDNLEKMGLVQRINSKGDRRVTFADLTPEGKKKIDSFLEKYSENIEKFSSALNNREQKTLIKLLDKILV